MLAQLTVSAQIEREMGSGGFFLTYFSAGIFGLDKCFWFFIMKDSFTFRAVLGANFALVGLPSIGASGAIFGTVAVCPKFQKYILWLNLHLLGDLGRSLRSLEVSISTCAKGGLLTFQKIY